MCVCVRQELFASTDYDGNLFYWLAGHSDPQVGPRMHASDEAAPYPPALALTLTLTLRLTLLSLTHPTPHPPPPSPRRKCVTRIKGESERWPGTLVRSIAAGEHACCGDCVLCTAPLLTPLLTPPLAPLLTPRPSPRPSPLTLPSPWLQWGTCW